MNKRGQITIFIIIAILLVAGIIIFFAVRNRVTTETLPVRFQSIELAFLDCVQGDLETGKEILGEKAGYIYSPVFEAGSEYSPFSSQLDFNGIGVPYWYYSSGNNIIKEQVPSKQKMEQELKRYLEENIGGCDFSEFESQGYIVNLSSPSVSVKINELDVAVEVNAELNVGKEGDNARQTLHKTKIDTKLGRFYDDALKIYNSEKQDMFLENYAVDVLRNYAPVDGVEISCAPQFWLKSTVDNDLKTALEANTQAIKTKSDYYSLNDKDSNYFVTSVETGEAVNFIYSQNWPTRIEAWDSSNGILMAEPVGMQQGLGVLGFCYVPYHFVYDIRYPVLVQVYDDREMFQFPVAVIIEKNMPRTAMPATVQYAEPELCKYKNTEVSVNTFDNNLNPVEASISFECLGQSCDIGKTVTDNEISVASLNGLFPQCGNGFIVASAEGYANKREIYSTNSGGDVDIVLDKKYDLIIDLLVDGEETEDYAVITFKSQDNSQTAVLPDQNTVKISEGEYNLSVYVYRNSSLTIPGVKNEKCAEVPKSGLLGLLGMTEEKCFNIDLPAQTVSNIVSGGGKGSEYIVQSNLEKGKIILNVNSIPLPTSVEKLQDGYDLIEASPVYVDYE